MWWWKVIFCAFIFYRLREFYERDWSVHSSEIDELEPQQMEFGWMVYGSLNHQKKQSHFMEQLQWRPCLKREFLDPHGVDDNYSVIKLTWYTSWSTTMVWCTCIGSRFESLVRKTGSWKTRNTNKRMSWWRGPFVLNRKEGELVMDLRLDGWKGSVTGASSQNALIPQNHARIKGFLPQVPQSSMKLKLSHQWTSYLSVYWMQ